MHGVFIENGPSDWQIIQHYNGSGDISLSGTFQVPKAAIEVGVEIAYPIIRVLSEQDNSQILPWTKVNRYPESDGMSGSWDITLTIPAGGLYRIETGLDTKSTRPELGWIFRGDVRVHIGIGDIFIIAGQSNSAGYGKDAAYDPPDLHVHLLRNRGTWDLACHPINESTFAADRANAEMGVSGTSPYLSFGRSFHQLSHYPVGLVITALGGSPISRWDNSQKGDLYRNMITRINECGKSCAGILWYQGCSDTNPEQASGYYDSFERLVNDTRKELGYEIPFFTFQLNRQVNAEYNEEWGIVRDAQRRAAHALPGVYILPALQCSLCDGIHNNSHSAVMLGEQMSRMCGSVLYHTPEFCAPDLTAAVFTDHMLRLTFCNMKRGFAVVSSNPAHSGFRIKDSRGDMKITVVRTDKSMPNSLMLLTEQLPEGPVTVSYGWESDPSHVSFLDEATYLPILAFYEFPVQITGN